MILFHGVNSAPDPEINFIKNEPKFKKSTVFELLEEFEFFLDKLSN